jgi:hypothetical protein
MVAQAFQFPHFHRFTSFDILHINAKQDENRYNRSRGANLNMDEEERAKEARILVNKIPGMYGMKPQPALDIIIK